MEYVEVDKETGHQVYKDDKFRYYYEIQEDKKMFILKGMSLEKVVGSEEEDEFFDFREKKK